MAIRYDRPRNWIAYDPQAIMKVLVEARAAMLALTQMPYQRSWAEELQQIQLKREVAGTSRIEGAEFTELELDLALQQTPAQLETRSQRQAAAAVAAYRWIAQLPPDRPVNNDLILEVHRRIVTGCDDDHCPPGQLRGRDQNVTFGAPRHRGVEGGEECAEAIAQLSSAVNTVFRDHDPLIQALALHHHFAAMHPFLDGNGRTARALEALMLQRIGLRDTLFIAMSNYYYEEKSAYLQALNDTHAGDHDLTPFLTFALRGIEVQCRRLFEAIRIQVQKSLYRNTMTDLFGRLASRKTRAMTGRQITLLNLLLKVDSINFAELMELTRDSYKVKNPDRAFIRDISYLLVLGAVRTDYSARSRSKMVLSINLDWPTHITETEFFRKMKELPKAKEYDFLSS